MNVYRLDIDGLRAVAVILVVMFHVGLPGIPGGFVGVDVFFVISGYLITGQLISEGAQAPSQLLLTFYARRARRILPSLGLVIIVVLGLSRIFLLPNGEQQDVAKSAIAASLFASNIFFQRLRSDYFATPSELQPLLHTWSLSVEEQYYLVFPCLLLFLSAASKWMQIEARKLALLSVLAISLLSILLSVWWTQSEPVAAFFSTPSRVWELGIGACLALLNIKIMRRLANSQVASVVGVGCIIIAALMYTSQTPFPGIAAALPVFGSALVILGGAGTPSSNGPAHRFLTADLMVTTGRISYSWYLWHWPLLAISRTNSLGARDLMRDCLLAAVAYALAYCTTRFLENPIRTKKFVFLTTDGRSLFSGLAVILVTTLIPLLLWAQARTEFQSEYETLRSPSLSCLKPFENDKLRPTSPCILSQGSGRSIFLIGDSHANHWSAAIARWGGSAGVFAIDRSMIGCNPFVMSREDSNDDATSECNLYMKLVKGEIDAAAAAGQKVGVVLSMHWARSPRLTATLNDDLKRFVSELEKIGGRILLVGATPTFPFIVPSCLARRSESLCRMLRTSHDEETMTFSEILNSVTRTYHNARFWNPTLEFCDDAWCYPTRDGKLQYFDEDHLTRFAAERAEPALERDLNWLVGM